MDTRAILDAVGRLEGNILSRIAAIDADVAAFKHDAVSSNLLEAQVRAVERTVRAIPTRADSLERDFDEVVLCAAGLQLHPGDTDGGRPDDKGQEYPHGLALAQYDADPDALARLEGVTGFLATQDLRAAAATSSSACLWSTTAGRRRNIWYEYARPDEFQRSAVQDTIVSLAPSAP